MGVGGISKALLRGHFRLPARGDEPAARRPVVPPGFRPELVIWFRAPGGREPDVLEIGMHGRRNLKVEAYWDGCLVAL